MSEQTNNPKHECKCGSAKQVADLQKKIHELHKYVTDTIPKLERQIETLRKAVRK